MGNFSKWLGAGLGFTLGGPIGAALGFALGSFVDGFSVEDLTSEQQQYRQQGNRNTPIWRFRNQSLGFGIHYYQSRWKNRRKRVGFCKDSICGNVW